MQFLQILKLILSLLPAIIDAVKSIEQTLPAGGQGAQKLDLVRQILASAYSTSTDAVGTFEQVWPSIQGTVNAVVSFLNVTGVFKKA